GRTLEGPHRSELLVRHVPKDMPAARCSTGEQKALLVGLILAHARLTGELSGSAPILLLDEISAHFDPDRRAALFSILEELNCQAFMTGTEASLFSAIEGRAQFFSVSAGAIHEPR
ncbi:DNA replication and repair protein RecF, partial [Nitratireductor aquimarinus]|nr:DNA replication and repair protein RecF [Nitratireductor aquimarinus]